MIKEASSPRRRIRTVQDTIPYTYYDQWSTDAWGDALLSYDGAMNCLYDAIGNPIRYYNGTSSGNIYTFTWANGRQLVSGDRSGTGFTYTYNADGLRTKKVVDGVTTEYYWAGSQLAMMVVNPDLPTEKVLKFYYDAEGRPIYFDLNGTTYFYVTNLQGDVVALTDSYGEVVSYQYDAWGKPLATDYISSAVYDAMYYNPLRYRGYIYDNETGFYYLQSRYYDPVVGRFINADSVGYLGATGTFLSFNLFAYCENNPVMGWDGFGFFTASIDFFAGAHLGIGFSKAYSIAFDAYGNVAIQKTTSNFMKKRNGIRLGVVSAGASIGITKTNLDNVSLLNGASNLLSGSVTVSGIDIGLGRVEDSNFDKIGTSVSLGASASLPVDASYQSAWTETLFQFNIIEVSEMVIGKETTKRLKESIINVWELIGGLL